MIVNGVALPDIPADVLEQYPYAVMFHRDETDGWVLAVAVSEYAYLLGDLIDTSMEGLRVVTSSGAGASFSCYQDSTAWNQTATHEAGKNLITIGSVNVETGVESTTMAVVWANHDIYEVTSIDFSTGEFVTGDIYFSNSEAEEEPEETKPPRYSIATAILDAVARQIMRLTDSTEKVKPEEFEPKLEGINIQLKELTVTATEEVQTITPPSGVYGFSKVIVEAVEDSGTGGGGGTPGEGGDGTTTEDYPDAESVTFGYEEVTREVETGISRIYTSEANKESGSYWMRVPNLPGGPCWAIFGGTTLTLISADEPFVTLSGDYYYATPSDSIVRVYEWVQNSWNTDWTLIQETTRYGRSSSTSWRNCDIQYSSWVSEKMPDPVPETTTETVFVEVSRDETYKIDGNTLTELNFVVQQITGKKDALTPNQAIDALEEYYASLNPETEE